MLCFLPMYSRRGSTGGAGNGLSLRTELRSRWVALMRRTRAASSRYRWRVYLASTHMRLARNIPFRSRRGEVGVLLCAGAVEAGLHFERKQVGVAEQAPLGVDEAQDDSGFDAVGGGNGAMVLGDHRVPRTWRQQCRRAGCERDAGGPLEAGDQDQASNHRELLSLRAMVVSVAETMGPDPIR